MISISGDGEWARPSVFFGVCASAMTSPGKQPRTREPPCLIAPQLFESMAEFTVCSSNALVIDQSILWGWLLGLSVDQMVGYRQPRTQTPVSNKVLKSYVLTQYRNFELLEHCLHEPRYFYEQQYLFPLSPQAKKLLVERYYGFDEPVMRELLGKKLSARARKDLDEVSEKTKIHLGSCRRQFDNLKWILKQVEDSENRPIIEEIQNYFMLSKDHAR
ncbi:acidic fibroblast growth factor binding-domain-containing protein [Jimgerdemannia flammicorona]|uniref:Acidic fibroblast growth factor binding-domain-containing protein n=1 Tax=Jimgerdemannia flammicorona TaxID=994334 RepID=A0A433AVP6_9FUNG|nr:acidic fibroblast growth factor binding-domain-containing protein [Jimgerdemannia flammicorona]